MTRRNTLSILTLNVNNPHLGRAERLFSWLAERPEEVTVLTQTADSAGSVFLAEQFQAAGYAVAFPRPAWGERGVMIVSRLNASPWPSIVSVLPHRAVAVTVATEAGPLDIVGLCVPHRDATVDKTERKRQFLEACCHQLPTGIGAKRVIVGGFEVPERGGYPCRRLFRQFEWDFNAWFEEARYSDASRNLHSEVREYAPDSRTRDGYRYDRAHVSTPLVRSVQECEYVHEPPPANGHLPARYGLVLRLALTPAGALETTDPTGVGQLAPAPS